MTVRGLGLDLVDVEGFAQQLADPASGFVDGTFTAAEQHDAAPDRIRGLAARFAAKEAFIKAWSSSRHGRPPALRRVDLREVEVRRDAYGRPSVSLHGEVAAAVGDDLAVRVSLSHDGGVATAVVMLSGA